MKSHFLSAILLLVIIACTPSQKVIAASKPDIEILETKIDLGNIDAETDIIKGQIHILNVGDETLRISKVDGPCSCFAGYSGDTVIEPGDGGVIDVEFTKSKIPSGSIERMVNVRSNDTDKPSSEVHFRFFVEREQVEEELRKLNKEVTRMRSELRVIRNDMKAIMKKLGVKGGTGDRKKTADTTVYDVNIGSSPFKGNANAPVTIVEFSDFQCPYCSKEYAKLNQVVDEFDGKVKLVYKHYPLAFHKEARPAHAAAELAKLQGGSDMFWKFHDLLIDNPKHLHIDDLREHAETVGMDLKKFDKVMADSKKIDRLLAYDKAEANRCNVTKTPTVMINGLKMTKRDIASYRTRINEELAKLKTTAKK